MIREFKGKVAVITGGASGIGRGYAHALAKRGMKLVLADIDKEALEKVSQELSEIGAEVMTVVTDVSDHTQVAHLAEVSYERFGCVNILCNNAGVGGGGPINLMTLENWNWVLGVNLFGVIYGIQYFFNRMLKSKEPCHIVNTSSLAGILTAEGQPYAASKQAVVSISESLALQCFNTNVGVSVVCPGYVNTNIMKNTEILSQRRQGLWQPTPEMIKASEIPMENYDKINSAGMDPIKMAEIVIKAIENDILYVLTHPGYIQDLRTRFDSIYEDTLKLHEDIEVKWETKTKIFNNIKPAFSVRYPENLLELKPNPIGQTLRVFLIKPVLFASLIPGFDLLIFVSRASHKRLEEAAEEISSKLKRVVRESKVISNKQIDLKDGTAAYESVIECISAGFSKRKNIHLSVIKDDHLIRISIFAGANYYNENIENLKKILYSLEFK
ncbi:MAG: SDR family NAD(P)-dependent oxidoreductase [Candidatus Thorarchaeota archaeon]